MTEPSSRDAGDGGPSTEGLAVTLVTDVYPPGCGGSGWSTHALAQTLVERGHAVEVVGLDPSSTGLTQRVFEGVRVTELGVRGDRRSALRRLGRRDYAHASLQQYLEARLVAEPGVRLLHAQHMHSGPPTIAAAARHGRASVVTLRDYWPVCLHGTSWWGGTECSGCSNVNLVGCLGEYQGWPSPVARAMVPWVRRRLAARRTGIEPAGRVVTVSRWVRERIERELPQARYAVLPNIVDATATRAAAEAALPLPLPLTGDYLMAAGKLVATKGFDVMLRALAAAGCELPVVIAGTGPEGARLRRQSEGLPFDVLFPGWVPHDSLLRAISGARAFLLPSAWSEPLSRLLLEAMSLATPVITWRSGGNPEHLESGVDAFVVDDADDLRLALRELDDAARAGDVGAAGERRARERFSPDAVYPALMDVYRDALAFAGASDDARAPASAASRSPSAAAATPSGE